MTLEEAKAIVLELLKNKGKAKNSELIKALGGDAETFELVKEDLIFEDLAEDKKGVGLIYIGPASDVADKQLRIFLSYGHDANEELVRRIKADLEERGHDVWFDKSGVKEQGILPGDDWRRSITDGITSSHGVMSFLSKHSTRDPGVCLDEIAIAIGVKGGNIQTILVESEQEVQAPTSLSHIQWLDMHDWKEHKEASAEEWEAWYQDKWNEIKRVVESDETERFAGEIEKLNEYLKPISSDSRVRQLLKKGLVGREWLFKAAEEWRTDQDKSSRLFWLMGAPGVGKSAFAAHLSHYGKGTVIATHFCEYDKSDHRNPNKIVRTLAFQLATRLPDYRKLLLTLPEIGEVEGKNPSEAFDYLLATPLQQAIDGGRERYLIVIDALDEAKEKGRNELVEMLARNAHRLPEWIGILVTSRPEEDVTKPLQGLNPYVLDPNTDDNRRDILDYLRSALKEPLKKRANPQEIIEQIANRSEGVFLLVERICLDVKQGHLSLDRIDEFPRSLGETYWSFFERQFPDIDKFKQDVRPALRAIIAAREPLPLDILQRISDWQDEELRDFTRSLGSLFPVTEDAKQEVIKYYHRSIADWITDDSKAGPYYVSEKEGHKLLANFGWEEYQSGPENMSRYSLAHLARHLCATEELDKLTALLTDLIFMETKTKAEMAHGLLADYEEAIQLFPEYREEKAEEEEYDSLLQKYNDDLVALSEGKIEEVAPIPSVKPLSQEDIDKRTKRIIENPSQYDRVRAFQQFFGSSFSPLTRLISVDGNFLQTAYNFANSGPVAKAAEEILSQYNDKTDMLLRTCRPDFQPISALIKTLSISKGVFDNLQMSRDGKYILYNYHGYPARVWETITGDLVHEFKPNDIDNIGRETFWMIGTRLVLHADLRGGVLNLWDLTSGERIRRYEIDLPKPTSSGYYRLVSASLSPDDRKISYCTPIGGKYIELDWRSDTSEEMANVVVNGNWPQNDHFNPHQRVKPTTNFKSALSYYEETWLRRYSIKTGDISTERQISKNFSSTDIRGVSIRDDWGSSEILLLNKGKEILVLGSHLDVISDITLEKQIKGSCYISQDGSYIICSHWDNSLAKYCVRTGRLLMRLNQQNKELAPIYGLTPDGKYAITACKNKADFNNTLMMLWDLDNGDLRVSSDRVGAFIDVNCCVGEHAITSLHSSIIDIGNSKPVARWRIGYWDSNTGRLISFFECRTQDLNMYRLLPTRPEVLLADVPGMIQVYDLLSGVVKAEMPIEPRRIYSIIVSPDGTKAYVTYLHLKRGDLLDLVKGERLARIETTQKNVSPSFSLRSNWLFIPDLLDSGNRTIQVWRTTDERYEGLYNLNKRSTHKSLFFLGRGFVTMEEDEVARLINTNAVAKNEIRWESSELSGDNDIRFSETNKLLLSKSRVNHCNLSLFDLDTGHYLREFQGHTDRICGFEFAADGELAVSGSEDGTLRVWEVKSGNCLKTLSGFLGSLVHVTGDCRKAFSVDSSMFYEWNLHSGSYANSATDHKCRISRIEFLPEFDTFLTVDDQKGSRVWNVEYGKSNVHKFQPLHENFNPIVAYYQDFFINVFNSHSGQEWDLVQADIKTGKTSKLTDKYYGSVELADLSADRKSILTAHERGGLCFWTLSERSLLRSVKTGCVSSYSDSLVRIRPDGRSFDLMTNRKQNINIDLWSLVRRSVSSFEYRGTIDVLAPDGMGILLGTGEDGTIRLWSVATPDRYTELSVADFGHGKSMNQWEISPCGRYAITSDKNSTVAWDLYSRSVIRSLNWGNCLSLRFFPDGCRFVIVNSCHDILIISTNGSSYDAAFVSKGEITAISNVHPKNYFVIGNSCGEAIPLEVKGIQSESPWVTPVRMFRFSKDGERTCGNWEPDVTAECPWCLKRFVVTQEYVDLIKGISVEAGLGPDDSPCLSLPREHWDNPGLLYECPECNNPIRFNPFLIDNSEKYPVTDNVLPEDAMEVDLGDIWTKETTQAGKDTENAAAERGVEIGRHEEQDQNAGDDQIEINMVDNEEQSEGGWVLVGKAEIFHPKVQIEDSEEELEVEDIPDFDDDQPEPSIELVSDGNTENADQLNDTSPESESPTPKVGDTVEIDPGDYEETVRLNLDDMGLDADENEVFEPTISLVSDSDEKED